MAEGMADALAGRQAVALLAPAAATPAPAPAPARLGGRRRTALWSVGAALAGQTALLVSGPLVARCLGVEDRGHLAMVVLVPMMVAQLCQLGLPSAVTWALAAGRGRGALPSGLGALMVALLAAAAVLHAAAALVVTAGADGQVRLVAVASFPTAPAILAYMLALAVLQGRGRFGAFNLLRTLPSMLYVGAALWLFLTGTGTLATIAGAWCGATCLVAVAAVVLARRAAGPAPGTGGPGLGKLTRFGLRSWLGSMSPLENFRLDQLVVGLVVSPAALGLYAVAASFANLPRFVAQSLGAVAFPAVAGQQPADQAGARRSAWRYTGAAAAACAAVVALLAAACPVAVPLLFGEAFGPAVGIAQLLLAGALLTGVRRVLADVLRGLGRPGAGTVAEVTTWVALLASLAVLVPAFGVGGAAGGFAISAAAGLAVLAGSLRRRPDALEPRP